MMKHIPISAAMLLAVTGLTCLDSASVWAEENRVPVDLAGQQTTLWCWAASGQMILDTGGTYVAQCALANEYRSRNDCCDNPSACVFTGWPEFDEWGHDFTWTNWGTALSFDQLRTEIDSGRPFGFAWGWKNGGGHYMVANGYKVDSAGTQWVWISDPWPVDTGSNRYVTYAEFVAGADHDTWINDYRIQSPSCENGGVRQSNGTCLCPDGWSGLNCSKFTTLPVGRWSFEDGTGTTVTDVSANGHTGTLINVSTDTVWSTDVPPVSYDNSFSLQLDGVNDYMFVGNVDFVQGDYSITAWMKMSSPVVGSTWESYELVRARDPQAGDGVQLEIRGDSNYGSSPGKLRYLHRFPLGATGGTNLFSADRVDDTAWHHVAAVKSGATLSLYVDGVLSASGTDSSTFDRPLEVVVGFLHSGSPRYFRGNIDDVQLYDVAVPETFIQALAAGENP